jgi:hypothetical protein
MRNISQRYAFNKKVLIGPNASESKRQQKNEGIPEIANAMGNRGDPRNFLTVLNAAKEIAIPIMIQRTNPPTFKIACFVIAQELFGEPSPDLGF